MKQCRYCNNVIAFFMSFMMLFILFSNSVFAANTGGTVDDIKVEVKSEEKTLGEGDNALTVEKIDINIDGINDDSVSQVSFWQKVMSEYREIITVVSAIASLTFIVFFILNFLKLGKSASNPQERQNAITGIIMTGIATACCGGVAIFTGFFYNILL